MALVRLIPDDTNIPFMALRRIGPALAVVLAVASLVLFFVPGLNYGIDFRGGIVVEVRTEGPADFSAMRSALSELGLGDVALQEFGAPDEVLIRVESQDGKPGGQAAAVESLRAMLTTQFAGADIRRVESVGAEVSDELFVDGVTALLFAFVAMLVYIWFRFEWAVRSGSRGHPGDGRPDGRRVLRGDRHTVQPEFGRGPSDHHRLFHQRQGGGVRPRAGKPPQVQVDAFD